jgi:hypothetical protein
MIICRWCGYNRLFKLQNERAERAGELLPGKDRLAIPRETGLVVAVRGVRHPTQRKAAAHGRPQKS